MDRLKSRAHLAWNVRPTQSQMNTVGCFRSKILLERMSHFTILRVPDEICYLSNKFLRPLCTTSIDDEKELIFFQLPQNNEETRNLISFAFLFPIDSFRNGKSGKEVWALRTYFISDFFFSGLEFFLFLPPRHRWDGIWIIYFYKNKVKLYICLTKFLLV